MRFHRPALATLAAAAVLAACAGPTGADGSGGSSNTYVPPGEVTYGPGDLCSDTYVIVQQEPTEANTRTNFSLGAENYRNDDFCAAYPYVTWLLDNDPLFTGEDPDDRNYLRLGTIYEYFAANVDSTDRTTRVAYLDSARTIRQEGRDALDAANVAYDPYLRDLREGFFYFQNQDVYTEEAEEMQYQAFNRAFEAKPDSLEDWYLSQLFNLSAAEYGNELPNPQRAQYVERLAAATDAPALQQYLASSAEYFLTDPNAAPGGVAVGSDEAVEALVADLEAGTIGDDEALQLLAVIIQQPERLEALGEDVTALRTQVLRLDAVTNQVDNPRTLVALAFQALREGDSTRGNQLFDRALTNAASNSQRADFLYARSSAGLGNRSQLINRALQYFPSHGPSLYARAGLIADAVGRPSSLTGRFAYWCLADEYRNVAAVTSDSRIAGAARRAAAGYERSGPSRESYFLEGYRPGQTVNASLGAYGSCSTRVR